jgi:tetratricopeptide (TPR) repeat protein
LGPHRQLSLAACTLPRILLTVLLTYLLGRQVFRPSVALVAAILLVFYGTITFYEGQLLMMWLGTLLNMSALYVLYRARDRSSLGKYALVGILLGLSALARANILAFVVVMPFWILFFSGEKRRWLSTAVLLAGTLITILPATIHNYIASRDFVPITSNGGVNFYVGNSAEATGIFYPPKGINLVTDDAVEKYVERLLGRELTASELSRYWYREAFDFIKNNPQRELRLLLRKLAMYFNGYEVPQIESYDIARQRHSSLRMLFVNFWTLLSLGLMGMIYSVKHWRRHFLLYGYIFSFSLSVILFFVTARYRAQITPVLALYAAYALVDILPGAIRNIRYQIRPLGLFVLIILLTRPALFALASDDVEWRELTHQARRWSNLGDEEKAIQEMNKAIEIHPDNVDSYLQRAVIYKAGGNLFKAISDYTKALDLNPNLPSVQYDYAQTLRQVRMYEPAIEAYLRAIQLNPRMLEAYNNLGVSYLELKEYQKAIEYFEKLIALDPRYTKAYNNLGTAHAESDSIDQAVEAFRKAIEIDPRYANAYKNLAMAYIKRSEIPQAYAALDKYLTLNPDDRSALGVYEKLRFVLENDTTRTSP